MLSLLLSISLAAEAHPKLSWQTCTREGCKTVNGYLVHDRHIGNVWDRERHGDLDYAKDIGVTTSGSTLQQKLVSQASAANNGANVIGSRLYLVDSADQKYELFKLVGKEFTYTVDMSEIPCGVNAALYTVEMQAAGKAPGGVQYGYGYCDANCVDGSCCAEFDIQEASSKAMVFTSHVCEKIDGGCDSSGCGYNPYRDSKDHAFWGTTIDVTKPVTVVTQFIGTAGTMTEVRRLYVQGGKVIKAAQSLSDTFCHYSATDVHNMAHMGASFQRGHVIVFSLWDGNGMSWMDGGNAGPCTSYDVATIEKTRPNLKVTWSNVKFGDIDSTY
uniref:cellulase n=1 Tax=uncultured symbiotic protist of Neotermes koshunensis TaxID=403660 RepID=A4UWX5_9EUKA|nr:putative glycosyl hydrolase family7 [uncultured symbiotic protist of Neotermes koshunensis]